MQQQRLHSINFEKLKNITEATVSFEPNNITGLFGINGSGKSTILHALLCLYKPSESDPHRKNYIFSNFFTPTSHATWAGSNFTIDHSYRLNGKENNNIKRQYTKNYDRWAPRYEYRPSRDVYYIGIDSCVPSIETESSSSLIRFDTISKDDAISQKIREKASVILNKRIQEFNSYKNTRREYFGFKENHLHYSSLYMGAGEQRIIKILSILFTCKKYSLLVIDEIELTLHTKALNKLFDVIEEISNSKNIQVIFTSHREKIIDDREGINIRHLHQTPDKTLVFNETTPDCIARLSGSKQRIIELFVEDIVSKKIIHNLIESKNINRFCEIRIFGAIENTFSLLSGLFLKGDNLDNILLIPDGDRYRNDEEKIEQLKKHLSGNEEGKAEERQALLKHIIQYDLPENNNPEEYIINALKKLNDNSEICNHAKEIIVVEDKHEYIYDLINQIGYPEYEQGLTRIIDKFFTTEEFYILTKNINDWLDEKIEVLKLTEQSS